MMRKMGNSMYARVLVVVAVLWLNPSSSSSSASEIESSSSHPDINILFFSMVNDMPKGTDRLLFIGNFQSTEVELEPGVPYQKITNFELKKVSLLKGTMSQFCVELNVYDPGAEGNHHNVYWSMRKDGIYHSWDNKNWNKKLGWGKCVF
ncbi:hypothetical protein ACSQ67_008361 [Phaseolus vulgaris]